MCIRDSRIRVLKTQEDHPNTQSALWIRRGGPPDKPVVLVDYTPTKSGEAAYGLLSEFKGTLVCDGATNFNLSVRRNGLKVALCNDHARRRFSKVHQKLSKEKKNGSSIAIASQGLTRYNKLYAIERKIKNNYADTQPKKQKPRSVFQCNVDTNGRIKREVLAVRSNPCLKLASSKLH